AHPGAGRNGSAPLHAPARAFLVTPMERAAGVRVLPPTTTGVAATNAFHSSAVNVHCTVASLPNDGALDAVRTTAPFASTIARRVPAPSVACAICSVERSVTLTAVTLPEPSLCASTAILSTAAPFRTA